MLRYTDFPVELAGDAVNAHVRVLGPVLGGEMNACEGERVSLDLAALGKLLRSVERRSAAPGDLFELGGALGSILFPGRVRELFDRSCLKLGRDSALRLRISALVPELAALPWELAHVARTSGESVEGDFLALRPDVSLVRHQHTGAPAPAVDPSRKVRIVAALASPSDSGALQLPRLDVTRDRDSIQRAVQALGIDKDAIELQVLNNASRQSLAEALYRADVFHFAGHGLFEQRFSGDGQMVGRGEIVLEQPDGSAQRMDSGELAVLLAGARVRLAVLGACDTAKRDAYGEWSGVAPALARENVPAVVAMQLRILDVNANTFLTQLYSHVLAGDPVDEAVYAGRRAIFADRGLAGRDWAVPVLYLRSSEGILFPLQEEENRAPADAPYVRVRQRAGIVRGKRTVAKVGKVTRGTLDVEDTTDVIEIGSESVTVEIDELG
jgi:hypothetical protein